MLLLAPQLLITFIFFIWPALQAVRSSFQREDPFGMKTTFVWFKNYQSLFEDSAYLHALGTSLVFAALVSLLSMGLGLVLATAANKVVRGSTLYRTLIIWPYAVAPAVAGALWWFMFNPSLGLLPHMLSYIGIEWNHRVSATDAMVLVLLAAAWKQISYNFLFFLAGLQSIPQSCLEAAAIDGAGPFKRFFDIVFPLLSPTSFFLLIININYAMFDTFPIIHATTMGGPGEATNLLVFKVYQDGVAGLDIGSSAAQSVVLMAIVVVLTFVQFRFVERRVNY